MTSLEGRVLRRRAALRPPPNVRSELWIVHELAHRLGAPSTFDTSPAAVFDELARASAGGPADYSGLSHELLDTGIAAFWPFPPGSTGTPRLFQARFAHADGSAHIVAVKARQKNHSALVGGTLTLITGRLLEHYQSGAQTRRVPELMNARPEARLQIHPATASRLSIEHESLVIIENARGRVTVRAEVSDTIRHDTVFLPFHFSDAQCANLLTESIVDPTSAMPEFKRTTVVVRPAPVATS